MKRRLAAWLVVAAAGHAALFYLFRVTPPVDSRQPPPQQSVLYLPSYDATARSLLSTLDDRYPGALLRPEDYSLKADMEALAKATPPSVPSWAAHRPALKSYPQPLVARELPGIMRAGEPLLPEYDVEALPSPGAPAAARPSFSVLIDDNPGSRTVTLQPEWPRKLPDGALPPSGNVSFKVGITREGVPEYCMLLTPTTGVEMEAQDALCRAVSGMRFSAVTTGPQWQWLTVTVRW